MEAAALSLTVKSDSVVQAANDLDRFSTAATKAAAAGGKLNIGGSSGSIAKLVAEVQAANSKLTTIIGTLEKVASAERATAAANDNAARSFANVDSHVIAYTQHLASLARAQQDANAHVLAYRNHLATLPPAAGQASDSIQRVTRAAGESAGAIRANTGNIAAQFQDIGVTAAMGMNPLIIALQQGTQLSAVFAQTGASMGATLKAAFLSIVSPQALLTIALVAGAAALIQWAMSAGESATAADRARDGLKTYTTEMGYTKEEVEKLNAVTVTFGDTTKAVFQVALRNAAEAMGINTADMARIWDSFLERIGTATRATLAGIYAGFAGMRSYLGEVEKGGLIGLGKMLIGQGDPELLSKTFGKAYKDGLKFLDDVGAQARANAQARQTEMARSFYDKPSGKKPKGGKTDAEKLADIIRDAEAQVTAEQNRAKAVGLTAQAAAELEKRTDLLNRITKAGIPITAAVTAEVDRLAAAYANAKVAADVAETIQATTDEIDKQRAAVADQVKLVGLYGDALERARREQEAQRKLRDALPNGEIVVMPNLTGGLSDDTEALNRIQRMEALRKSSEDALYALDLERQGLGLTGAAALSYAYVVNELNKRKREGIAISPAELASIQAAGEAYGTMRHAIDQQARSMSDTREVTRGFLTDLVEAARKGGDAFKNLADTAINSLNRIIDKLTDRGIDSFLDSMFARPFDASSLRNSTNSALDKAVIPRFAKGAAFTNTIVNTPTLFRFANGAALGEMGEAGPEAIMPLKRGPNGALGVQMHSGGGTRKVEISIPQEFNMQGVMTPADVSNMVRQGAAAAVEEVRRNLDAYLREWDMDGAVAS